MRKLLPLFAFFLLAALPALPWEAALENGEGSLAPERDDRLYVIVDFDVHIVGRTRPNILMGEANLRVGEELRGRAALEAYIRDRTQALTNLRVLRDNPEVSYLLGERRADGSYPVTIVVRVEDSLNVIAFPVPSYHSHRGMGIDIRARDYNLFGTMRPLRIDLGYNRDNEGRNSFRFMLDASVPFSAFGFDWNFRFENDLRYRPGVEEPFFFRNITGLSVNLPLSFTMLTVGFDGSVIVNHEVRDGLFQSGPYMSSRAFASWRIPTGLRAGNFGELAYTIGPSVTFNHELPGRPFVHDSLRGPFVNLTHSLGFGRIDWRGNFRSGLSASLTNSFSYDIFRYASEPFGVDLSFSMTAHLALSRFLGASARIQSRRWFTFEGHRYHGNAGDVLRGIADDDISAEHMLSVNMNLPFRALDFAPSRWFDDRRWRLFDFEFHVSPMLDVAIFDDPRGGTSFAAAGGLEFMVFPGIVRAMYLRLSVGADVLWLLSNRQMPSGRHREITLGLGHFF